MKYLKIIVFIMLSISCSLKKMYFLTVSSQFQATVRIFRQRTRFIFHALFYFYYLTFYSGRVAYVP